MSPPSRSLLLSVLAAACAVSVHAQGTFPPTPMSEKRFPSPTDLPYKVDTDQGLIRGTQHGFNICNSTTEGQKSDCQTSYINGIDDFCLWGPPNPESQVGDTEGEMVAWCTKPGHGTRLIPAGALTGVQWMKTPDYVQVVGYIDQSKINIKHGDFGGEMDPHGADLRGNPMGGVIFSNAYNGQVQQVIEWHNFIGSDFFCLKACDPKGPNAAHFCEHVLDRIGCAFNAPNAAQNGTFEACEGENQDFPGVYTGTDGQVTTYKQPDEKLGPITSMPYVARVPASSNCKPFSSAALFAGLPSAAATTTTTKAGAGATGTGSGVPKATGTGTPKPTGTGTSGNSTGSNDASMLAVTGISFMGVLFSAIFLA